MTSQDEVAVGSPPRASVVLHDARRTGWGALHAALVLGALLPRAGRTWRPVCHLCVESLDAALADAGGPELEAHRVGPGLAPGCRCWLCGDVGRDARVAAVPDDLFEDATTVRTPSAGPKA